MACLDTSVIIDFLKGKQYAVSTVQALFEGPEGLSTTTITEYELLKYQKPKERERMLEFVSHLKMLDFDVAAARAASEDYIFVEKKGAMINELDILIAGIAMANDEILFTVDHDFESLGRTDIKILDR